MLYEVICIYLYIPGHSMGLLYLPTDHPTLQGGPLPVINKLGETTSVNREFFTPGKLIFDHIYILYL